MDIVASAVLLFLIMDPLGNIPLFLSVLKTVPESRRSAVLRRELLIALGVLLLFLAIGSVVFDFLKLSREAISIGGGVILFLIALRMIFPTSDGDVHAHPNNEPLVVPLAIPMIAGPSSLAMIMLMKEQASGDWLSMFLVVILAWVASAIILLSSRHLFRLLGERGLIAIERLMGMVLIIMSIQMLLEGVAQYLQNYA